MDTFAQFAKKKFRKDILAQTLLKLSEKQNARKRGGYPRVFEGIQRLSPRQAQIVKLLLEGYSYGEIANTFLISTSTVHSHARRIYGILGVKGKHELFEQVSDEEYDLIRKMFDVEPCERVEPT